MSSNAVFDILELNDVFKDDDSDKPELIVLPCDYYGLWKGLKLLKR